MFYFLVTFAIMAVSILLIYRVTRFFGLQVERWALILCAVMAVGVNFASIVLSSILTLDHLLVIIGLVLIAAALVTVFNEYLLRRHGPVLAGLDVSLEGDGFLLAEGEAEPLPEPGPAGAPLRETADEGLSTLSPVVAAMAPPAPLEDEPEPSLDPPLAPQEAPAAPSPLEEEGAEMAPMDGGAGTDLAAALAAMGAAVPAEAPEAAPLPEGPAAAALSEEKTVPIGLELARLQSLDDYLDYAVAQSGKGCFSHAILAYQQALEKFREDPYVPFIIIEMGNIYKELGAYGDAIGVYRGALRLPQIKEQESIKADFKKNIAYLNTVLQVLTRHREPALPFRKIPPDYQREIEEIIAAELSGKN